MNSPTKLANSIKSFTIPDTEITSDLPSKKYVEGEVLVKYKEEIINLNLPEGPEASTNLGRSVSMEKREDIPTANVSVLKIKDGKSVEQKITELNSLPEVEYAEPNYLYYAASINTDDPYRDNLWGLDNFGQSVAGQIGVEGADISAVEAWSINDRLGQKTPIIVAVIDNGVAYNHPELSTKMWDGTNCNDYAGSFLGGCNHGYDFHSGDKTPLPTGSHGSHIAGTIAAVKNNNTGIIGVAQDVQIMALRAGESYSYTLDNIIKSVGFARENGAKIINASFGNTEYSANLYTAISLFRDEGGIFVAAAGNEGTNNDTTPFYPAGYDLDNIISVAASGQSDELADFSNYGANSVDIGAPGVNIYSTDGYRVLEENFDNLSVPSIGSKFVQSGNNSWGTLSSDDETGKVAAGDYLYWGNYRNLIDSNLDTIAINLESKPNSYLGFTIFCDTEKDYDGVQMYFWDGSDWALMWFYSGFGILNEEIPLNQYPLSNFKVRFKWITDSMTLNGPYYGCFLDNVKVVESSTADGSYMYSDGTSMAAPHVTGLAALLWGHNPNLSYSEVIDIILETGDTKSGLVGKTLTGKRINAHKALTYGTSLDNVLLNTKYFTWYDTKAGNYAWNLVANPSDINRAFVGIDIGGLSYNTLDTEPYSISTPLEGNIQTGPVKIKHENEVIATQRVIWGGTFNELPAIDADTLTDEYYFTWNDTKSGNHAWTLIGVPDTALEPAVVDLYIEDMDTPKGTYTINPGQAVTPEFTNIQSGPVKVKSSNGINFYTTQRVIWGGSFNEFAGIPANTLTDEYYFTWNDTKNGNHAWTLIGVPDTALEPAVVDLYISDMDTPKGTYTINPGQAVTPEFTNIQSGPVKVKSSNGINFYTTQRVIWGGSFNEFAGIPANTLTNEYYFTWNDTKGGNHAWTLIGVPDTALEPAVVDLYISDMDTPKGTYTINPGQAVTPEFTNIQSGPVKVKSSNGINFYTTQRVIWGGSFNEFAGIPVIQVP
jgi:subtilisin family serine protease